MAKEADMAHHSMTIGLSTLALATLLAAHPAQAQTVRDDAAVPEAPLIVDDEPEVEGDGASAEPVSRGRRAPSRPRVRISPYIEVGQILTAELGNGGDVLTYSSVAVGVEAAVSTRQAQAAADVRYERRIGWGDSLSDNDVISGAARGRFDLAPGFSLEGGALASRASVDGRGGTVDFTAGDTSNSATIYSIYAGPTFGRRIGDFDVGGAYRFGYSKSDVDFGPVLSGGSVPVGTFDDATNHSAIASIGARPGSLPFGWRVSGGWDREDAGQLDQRYQALFARLDLTVPVSPTLALVGGIGYEDIEVSNRQPLLAADGRPVLNRNGRLVSDTAAPRQIAFDTSGLIYDAGVLWRPNRRMSLEARVGRRYDDLSVTGSWSWQATQNTSYQFGIYDNLSTVGRQLSAGLAALPTDFTIDRNPIDGSIGGCAFGAGGGTCLSPTLANASGFAFRSRGAVLSMSSRVRPWSIGVAFGYDRRSYVADGLVGIPGLDGAVDETFFAYLSASRQLSERTGFGMSAYATYFDSGLAGSSDALSTGVTTAVTRAFFPGLTGNAALSYNAIDQQGFDTRSFASALLGLRYSFR
jgi:hypothetical protein